MPAPAWESGGYERRGRQGVRDAESRQGPWRTVSVFRHSVIPAWTDSRLQIASSISTAATPARADERMLWSGPVSLSRSTRDGDDWNTLQFEISGPVVVAERNHIPHVERIEPNHSPGLFPAWKHSNLYAPRRSGKRAAPEALQGRLNSGPESNQYWMHVNIEATPAWRENFPQGDGGSSRPAGRVREPSAGRLVGSVLRKVLAGGDLGIALQKSLKRGVQTDS